MKTFLPMLLVASALSGVIVDRVAVSLGNRVITSSEIQERIALTAFQNRVNPAEDAVAWKMAAEQLIDQKIVEREMQVGRYTAIDDEGSAELLDKYRKEHYASEDAMQAALKKYALTANQLRLDLARQTDLLNFLNLRFRPAVQVTDEDIRNFYRDNVASKGVTIDEARTAIEETLTNQRADRELDTWIKDQRKRLKIEYHQDAFPAGSGSQNESSSAR